MLNISIFTLLLFVSPTLLPDSPEWINTTTPGVQDYALNPILRATDFAEWILGDPSIVRIGDELHLWANEIFHGIRHYKASVHTPFNFTKLEASVIWPGADRCYAHYDNATGTVVLYYEQYEPPFFNTAKLYWVESTTAGPSGGKWEWSRATLALEPSLPWELIGTKRVGNPFVYFDAESKKWRLYYSASSIHLADANIDEPLHFGLALADDLRGPWTRASKDPVTISGGEIPGTSFIGAGSLKMAKGSNGKIQALCNRITQSIIDGTNHTGSTISSISLLNNTGLSFTVDTAAFIAPTPSQPSWKRSYVYAFDTIEDPLSEEWMLVYYNARNDWKNGTETIGVSRVYVR